MKHLLTLLCLTVGAAAGTQSFDFKDAKGVNNAVFKLDAALEAINGNATGVAGTVQFDPSNPASTKGRITIATSSLHVGNPMMKEHLQGEQWMNVAQFPEIVFDVKELKNVKTSGDVTSADAVGAFSMKGIEKTLSVPVKLTYLKDKLGARTNGRAQGDLLVIRSTFTLKRSDFALMPGQMEDKVANDIEITLSIAGAAPRS